MEKVQTSSTWEDLTRVGPEQVDDGLKPFLRRGCGNSQMWVGIYINTGY